MCQALDDLRTEGRNEGFAIGKLEGQLEGKLTIILNMLRRQMSDSDICVLTECTPEFLEEIRKDHTL